MTASRIPLVVLVIAAIFAAIFAGVGVRTSGLPSDHQANGPDCDRIDTLVQPLANGSHANSHDSVALVPADQTPELFADGTASSLGLILIQEIKRTRSLDDTERDSDDNASAGVRFRKACSECKQRLELLLTLSSLHVRLQV